MVTMFVKHKVNNYGVWKRIYDEFSKVRKEYDVTGASVHRDPEDPNLIIVTHQFKDLNKATTFANSVDLKSVMSDAGVQGPPEIWIAEDIEHTAS